ISLEKAAARCWDCVVVGAGPAGSLAARQAAIQGLHVLLIDRAAFPRWKVCGCCINLAALATLNAVGLPSFALRHQAVPLRTMCLAVGSRQARLRLPGGAGLSREELDSGLIEAALGVGVEFLPEPNAFRLGPSVDGARQVWLDQKPRRAAIAARVILAADGL